jgi:thioredoxin-like negative regulator of GroEL
VLPSLLQPTFQFHKDGKPVGSFQGANPKEVEKWLADLGAVVSMET